MTKEEINKKIQDEKYRHQRKINRLNLEICKEKEHFQRTMEYLNKQKNTKAKEQLNKLEQLLDKALR